MNQTRVITNDSSSSELSSPVQAILFGILALFLLSIGCAYRQKKQIAPELTQA